MRDGHDAGGGEAFELDLACFALERAACRLRRAAARAAEDGGRRT